MASRWRPVVLGLAAAVVLAGAGAWLLASPDRTDEARRARARAEAGSTQDAHVPSPAPTFVRETNDRQPIGPTPTKPETATEPAQLHAARAHAAATLYELYLAWDDERFTSLFPEGTPDNFHELIDGYRAQLGECEPPVVWHEGETMTRFASRCEHGIWELAPLVDVDGKIVDIRTGAQGVEPGTAVREAAEAAMKLWDEWSDSLFRETFVDTWNPTKVQDLFARKREVWGPCSLSGVDLANARGALFMLECEVGPQTMKIDLAQDDRIQRFALFGPRPDRPTFEDQD